MNQLAPRTLCQKCGNSGPMPIDRFDDQPDWCTCTLDGKRCEQLLAERFSGLLPGGPYVAAPGTIVAFHFGEKDPRDDELTWHDDPVWNVFLEAKGKLFSKGAFKSREWAAEFAAGANRVGFAVEVHYSVRSVQTRRAWVPTPTTTAPLSKRDKARARREGKCEAELFQWYLDRCDEQGVEYGSALRGVA